MEEYERRSINSKNKEEASVEGECEGRVFYDNGAKLGYARWS